MVLRSSCARDFAASLAQHAPPHLAMRFALDTTSLSLSPLPNMGRACLYGVGPDVLRLWPNEYYNDATANDKWSSCVDWSGFGSARAALAKCRRSQARSSSVTAA